MHRLWRCFVPRHTSINTTFLKLGTKDFNMMMSLCYCFPGYNVFRCFSLKERGNLLNVWCKIKIYFIRDHRNATHENIAFYDHCWNKFLSYTNIQQISTISYIYNLIVKHGKICHKNLNFRHLHPVHAKDQILLQDMRSCSEFQHPKWSCRIWGSTIWKSLPDLVNVCQQCRMDCLHPTGNNKLPGVFRVMGGNLMW